MSLYLLCLTTNGGLPILTRKKGDCDNLPFSTVASLNGFHMFFKSLRITLQITYSEDWTYVWRDFHNAVTLIVCGRTIAEDTLQLLAELVFGAIALFVNYNELKDTALLDRLKKEAKNYVPLVDAALEACTTRLFGFTECVLSTQSSQLLQRLNEFSALCGSLFCCLVIRSRVTVGTEGWWDLDSTDRELLLLLLNSSNMLQNDVPVYLPKKNCMVAYRFVTIPLAPSSVLCVICGAEPTFRELRTMGLNAFGGENLLQNVEQSITRHIPDNVDIDPSILALILANTNQRKCVFTRNFYQNSSGKRVISSFLRLDMLKKCFDQAIYYNELSNYNVDKKQCVAILDQYWCLDYHKCYAHCDELGNVIFILFISSVPTHVMKFIARKLLYSLLHDKATCW